MRPLLAAVLLALILPACGAKPSDLTCPDGWTALRAGYDITYRAVIECRSPDGTEIQYFDVRGQT